MKFNFSGKKYRPSNGTEGLGFMENFCFKCRYDNPEINDYCDILNRTFIYDIDHEDYPGDWIYDKDGHPICTSFEQATDQQSLEK